MINWRRMLNVRLTYYNEGLGFSVRCVKDKCLIKEKER